MSATDLAAVIVAGCSVVAVVLLAVALASLVRTLRALRDVATVLRTETVPVLEDLRDTVEAANYEIIRLDGYTDVEKRGIARTHLLPKLLESAGLRSEELALTDEALDAMTAEAEDLGLYE